MNDRLKKAEYLFDELGAVEDSFVAEAMSYRSLVRKSAASWRRAVAVAAAVAVVATVSVSALLIGMLRDGSDDESGNAAMDEAELKGFEEVLKQAQTHPDTQIYADADSVELFDGQPKLIWRSGDGGTYYALTVSEKADSMKLSKALEATYSASENVKDGEDSGVRVWISYGDGKVVSPYLRDSDGNIGYGELFEYSPEIIPSQEFASFATDLISE